LKPFYFVNSFDFDLVDYTEDLLKIDYLELDYLLSNNNIFEGNETLYIRVDNQVFQDKDYSLYLNKVLNLDFEFGAHIHPYKLDSNKWSQETDIETISNIIDDYKDYYKYFQSVRMGWGYVTNSIMKKLSNHFTIDSSAIPRPKYDFDNSVKDWSLSDIYPYCPSKDNYMITGNNNLDILEIPISTTNIMASYDTIDMIRYINLSFKHKYLKKPLSDWISKHNFLVTITHPYEIIKELKHDLISFSEDEYIKNIEYIKSETKKHNMELKCVTISELAKELKNLY
jgi:hypothetical protein